MTSVVGTPGSDGAGSRTAHCPGAPRLCLGDSFSDGGGQDKNAINGGAQAAGTLPSPATRERRRGALLPPTLPIYTCSQPCIQSIHPHTHRHTPLSSSCSCWAAEHPAGHCASPALENNSQFVLSGFATVVQTSEGEGFTGAVQEPRGC